MAKEFLRETDFLFLAASHIAIGLPSKKQDGGLSLLLRRTYGGKVYFLLIESLQINNKNDLHMIKAFSFTYLNISAKDTAVRKILDLKFQLQRSVLEWPKSEFFLPTEKSILGNLHLMNSIEIETSNTLQCELLVKSIFLNFNCVFKELATSKLSIGHNRGFTLHFGRIRMRISSYNLFILSWIKKKTTENCIRHP